MRTIKYSFVTNHDWDIDHLDCIKPLIDENYEPFKNLTKETASIRKGVVFLKCPAHTDFIKNTFVWCAPWDMTLNIEVDDGNGNGTIWVEGMSQEQFEKVIDTRFLFDHERGIDPHPVIGVDWLCTFQTEKSTLIQLMPAFMHYNDFTSKAWVIPGEFDISKWTRPVEIVFEIKNLKERIEIKKGDAIAYVKFLCDDGDNVKLEKSPTPWEEIKQCNEIRVADKFRPLKDRYEKLEEVKSKGCPYDHKSK